MRPSLHIVQGLVGGRFQVLRVTAPHMKSDLSPSIVGTLHRCFVPVYGNSFLITSTVLLADNLPLCMKHVLLLHLRIVDKIRNWVILRLIYATGGWQ